jgi:hypothetical protein
VKLLEQLVVVCVVGVVLLVALASVLPVVGPWALAFGLLAIAWRAICQFFPRP